MINVLPLLAALTIAALPIPSPRQLAWHALERYAFCHFGPNTFTGKEWGEGTERPEVFDPKNLDCRQWARTFKAAGFRGIIITAKHHDGFCLWPSKQSTHTVAQSKWRGGKGDVLLELSKACKAEGLEMGVYLSPWDRNHPDYGTPKYNDVFKAMLREVLTHYGPIFEVWFDGANGEGPNGKRQVYDWPGFVQVVRECQPNAVIFSDAGPDVRWVGNEDGYAGETNWATLDHSHFEPGKADQAILNHGDENGPDWIPSECDVSIRPGWFWRSTEDAKLKSLDKLMDIYYGSVGRGSNLLLNVPPNADGLISEVDAERLLQFNATIEAEYSKHLIMGVVAPGAEPLVPKKYHYFSYLLKPGSSQATVTFDFGDRRKFDRGRLAEAISEGQRVKKWELQAETNHGWKTFATGTTIGPRRLVRFPVQEARRVRFVLLEARDQVSLTDIGFFRSPEIDREE